MNGSSGSMQYQRQLELFPMHRHNVRVGPGHIRVHSAKRKELDVDVLARALLDVVESMPASERKQWAKRGRVELKKRKPRTQRKRAA